MEFDLVVFIACMVGGASLTGLGVGVYNVLGAAYDRLFETNGSNDDPFPFD